MGIRGIRRQIEKVKRKPAQTERGGGMRWDEEVAMKEKVCPPSMTFVEAGRYMAHNCVGSKCMAWRGTLGGEVTLVTDLTGKEQMTVVTKPSGYCGMAGPPE